MTSCGVKLVTTILKLRKIGSSISIAEEIWTIPSTRSYLMIPRALFIGFQIIVHIILICTQILDVEVLRLKVVNHIDGVQVSELLWLVSAAAEFPVKVLAYAREALGANMVSQICGALSLVSKKHAASGFTPKWTLADLTEIGNSHTLIWHTQVIQHVMHLLLILFLHLLEHVEVLLTALCTFLTAVIVLLHCYLCLKLKYN